jgi:hypothetical protein
MMKRLALFALFVCVALTPPVAEAGFRYLPVGGASVPITDMVVEGFADQVPITVALRQILPRGMVYSVGNDVDINTKVSWQGGRPWRDVLNTTLQSVGLRANYTNTMVRVEKGPFALNPPVRLTPPVTSTVIDGGAPIALTPPSATHRVAGEITSLDADGAVAPLTSSTVMALGTTPASAPLNDSGAVKIGSDFTGQPKTSSLVEITSFDPDIKAEVAAGVTGPATPSTGFVSAANTADMKNVLTLPDGYDSTIAPLNKGPRTAPTIAMGQTAEWSAKAGQMLHDVIEEWSARTGVEVNWQAEYDYPLQASLHYNGTFEDAIRTLLYGFRDATPQPIGRLHKNEELGQQVLVVTVRGNQYDE